MSSTSVNSVSLPRMVRSALSSSIVRITTTVFVLSKKGSDRQPATVSDYRTWEDGFLKPGIHIVGGGLAGCEAAWQVARAGLPAILYEMRPHRPTEAHRTGRLAELVCSNSLKSESENTAPWLLKRELRRLESLLLRCADQSRVPGGHALTVDRELFAQAIETALTSDPLIEIRREEVPHIPPEGIWIVASGPLTSGALADDIARFTGSHRLYFYDSISPIADANTIDTSIAFRASRYGKSLDGSDDYLNCPFDKDQYVRFLDALLEAQPVPAHISEDKPCYFEACLPLKNWRVEDATRCASVR
jgi:methylenetetrahydrofolate--tRNA-(uracil-5-)-methyltransferase